MQIHALSPSSVEAMGSSDPFVPRADLPLGGERVGSPKLFGATTNG
jgi:hypothetical protein